MRRLAKRRGIELKAVSAGDLSLRSDPFRLLLVLGSVIDHLADALESGGEIVLQSQNAPDGAAIRMEMLGPKKPGWEGGASDLFSSLQGVLEALQAKLVLASPPAQEGVVLTIANL